MRSETGSRNLILEHYRVQVRAKQNDSITTEGLVTTGQDLV